MSETTEKPGSYWRKKEEGNLLYKIKQWFYRKIVDKETLEQIKKVAWELSEIFPHHILAKATIKSKTNREANEVHGYILLHYPQTYRKLIFDNRVIDLACLYARRNFSPQILNYVSLEDLDNFRSSLMLIERSELKNYPEVTFDKVIIYTKKEFYDSISKEHDAKIEWNGWETIGKKLYLNASLMAMISDDLPMIIATYTPGKSTLFYEADFDDKEKQHAKERILTKAYHQAQVQLATFQKKIDKTQKLATDYAKMLSDATKEAERQRYKDFRSKIEEIDRKKEILANPNSENKLITNWTPIIAVIILLIGALILLLVYLRFQPHSTNTSTDTMSSSIPIYRTILNIVCMRL